MTNKKEKFDSQPHDIDALADALTSFDRTSKIMHVWRRQVQEERRA